MSADPLDLYRLLLTAPFELAPLYRGVLAMRDAGRGRW